MAKIVVSSVFSPNMLGLEFGEQSYVVFKRITLEEAKRIIENADKDVVCSTSTREYAIFLEDLLGLKGCKKRNIAFDLEDEMIVFTVKAPRPSTPEFLKKKVEAGEYKIYYLRR